MHVSISWTQTKHSRSISVCINALALLILTSSIQTTVFVQTSVAQDERGGFDQQTIEVTGLGERLVRPQVMVIRVRIAAHDKSAANAFTNLQAKKALLFEQLQSLEQIRPSLSFQGTELTYRLKPQRITIDSQPSDQVRSTTEGEFVASDNASIRVVDIAVYSEDQLLSIASSIIERLDKDRSQLVQDQPIIRYETENIDTVREALYATAIKDAREKAELLARLNDLRITRVDRIDQVVESTLKANDLTMADSVTLPSFQERQLISSKNLQPNRIRVSLRVRFRFEALRN